MADEPTTSPKPRKKRRVQPTLAATQEDVARVSGVSAATVSHVLNGRSTRVSEATRQRVLEAVRQLQYKPPPVDHRLNQKSTRTISVLVGDLGESPIFRNLYFGVLLDGLLEHCARNGMTLAITAERMWDDDGNFVRHSYDGRCDGAILVGENIHRNTALSLAERGLPVVQLGGRCELQNCGLVDVDNLRVGRDVARYLLQRGHKHVWFVGGAGPEFAREARLEGFLEVMDHGGARVQVFENDRVAEVLAAKSLVESPPHLRPTAVFCYFDDALVRFLPTILQLGLSVPDDISIISVDDFTAAQSTPPITAYTHPVREMAHVAVDLVLEANRTGVLPLEPQLFVCTLAERSSVKDLS